MIRTIQIKLIKKNFKSKFSLFYLSLLYDLGLNFDDIICERAFLQIDKGKNGLISFEEFFDWWKSEEKFKQIDHNIKVVTQASEIFSRYDTDRSGFLDVKEFQLCLKEFAKAEKKEIEVEKIVKALDKNGGKFDFVFKIRWKD